MTDAKRLNRLNVQLLPEAATALDDLVRTTKLSRTDLTNRALQLYGWLLEQQREGSRLKVVSPDGELEWVKLL